MQWFVIFVAVNDIKTPDFIFYSTLIINRGDISA